MCEWNNEPLDGGEVALEVVSLLGGTTPIVMLAAASSGQENMLLRPDQLGDFLIAHRGRHLICDDAARIHWTLYGFFLQATQARDALWRFSEDCCLYDVALLAQLVDLAEGGACSGSHELAISASQWLAAQLQPRGEIEQQIAQAARRGSEQLPCELREMLLRRAETLRQAYVRLTQRAERFRQPAEPFGPLGIGLQVQGAIALRHVSEVGVAINEAAKDRCLPGLETERQGYSRRLLEDGEARNCFRHQGHQITVRNGYPDTKRQRLRDWLERITDELRLHADVPVLVPRLEENGQVSEVPAAWGTLRLLHPLLQAWAGLFTLSRVIDRLETASEQPIRPRYQVLPRAEPVERNDEQLRLLIEQGLLRSTREGRLVVLELCDLPFRALASVCQQQFGYSRLAEEFSEVNYARDFLAPALASEFAVAMRGVIRETQDWNKVAQAFLLGISLRFNLEQTRAIARHGFQVDVPVACAQAMWERIQELFPELREYVADRTMGLLAERLDVDLDVCRRRLVRHLAEGEQPGWVRASAPVEDSETLRRIRRAVLGFRTDRELQHLLHDIADLNRNPELAHLLAGGVGNLELYEAIFARPRMVPRGRVRRAALFSEESAEHLDLADDAAKAAAYALVAAGYELCGYGQNVFVVVLSNGQDGHDVIARMAREVERAAGMVLQVPVRCVPRYQD
jgi:hypothetical protein